MGKWTHLWGITTNGIPRIHDELLLLLLQSLAMWRLLSLRLMLQLLPIHFITRIQNYFLSPYFFANSEFLHCIRVSWVCLSIYDRLIIRYFSLYLLNNLQTSEPFSCIWTNFVPFYNFHGNWEKYALILLYGIGAHMDLRLWWHNKIWM